MLHQIMLLGVTVSPKASPISAPLQEIVNVVAFAGVLLAVLGFLAGAAISAVAGQAGNYRAAQSGHSMMLRSGAAAALIAGSAAIVNWAGTVGKLF